MTAPAPISHLSADTQLSEATLEWVATKLAEGVAHQPVIDRQKVQDARSNHKRLWKGQRQQSASLEAMSEKELLIEVVRELRALKAAIAQG